MTDEVDHTHGSTGSKPPQDLNFEDGDLPNPEQFDWFWSEVSAAINDHAAELDAIDADDDGVVDGADTATKVKGNDIDSDGDGVVDAADTAAKVKGNDIDSDGDGIVDQADLIAAAFSASDGSTGEAGFRVETGYHDPSITSLSGHSTSNFQTVSFNSAFSSRPFVILTPDTTVLGGPGVAPTVSSRRTDEFVYSLTNVTASSVNVPAINYIAIGEV